MVLSGQFHGMAALPWRREPLIPTEQGVGWVTEPSWKLKSSEWVIHWLSAP
jgi:hypothetical protein